MPLTVVEMQQYIQTLISAQIAVESECTDVPGGMFFGGKLLTSTPPP